LASVALSASTSKEFIPVGDALQDVRMLVVGASSGIGRAVAEQATAQGAKVAAAARRSDLLEDLARMTGCAVAPFDITDSAGCAAGVEQLIQGLGGLDVVLVSSGASPLMPVEKTSAQDWQDTLAVNLVGPNIVLAAAVPHLAPDGLALVISSDAVGHPRHGLAAYNASKAALDESLRSWRPEHPDLRLIRLSIGPTMGTDIARNMDPEVAMELFPAWVAHGQMREQMMHIQQVAASIMSIVDSGLRCPTVVCESMVLRPRGGLISSTDWMIEQVQKAQDGTPSA
jgi:NAD(P)-dependent dehydrogenase (short-subunit alcohol dehydrogenase family)